MELRLENGAYCATRSGLATVTGAEELAQRLVMRLTARRGGFAPLPEYGSRLYLLHGIKPSQRGTAARQYIAEALREEHGVELESVDITEREGEGLLLNLCFRLENGEAIAVNTTI
jgi:hypothetical protein